MMKKHSVSHRGIHVETYVSEAGQPVGPERALFADLRRRAEAGEAVAQNDLGGSYASGINGASRDSAAAFKWFA